MGTPAPASARTARAGRARAARLALILSLVLAPAAGAQAQDVCTPRARAGADVWYAVEPQPRLATSSESGCTTAAGEGAQVRYFREGAQEIILCTLDLTLPPAMLAELDAARRQRAAAPPGQRSGRGATWDGLVRKYSPQLACAPGFVRRADTTTEVPSAWCQRRLTARQLCPDPGSTFTDGACSSMACPAGMVDLGSVYGPRLAGCLRCPAGQLDVGESLAARHRPAWSSNEGPLSFVLCKARSSDPCPGTTPLTQRAPEPTRAVP